MWRTWYAAAAVYLIIWRIVGTVGTVLAQHSCPRKPVDVCIPLAPLIVKRAVCIAAAVNRTAAIYLSVPGLLNTLSLLSSLQFLQSMRTVKGVLNKLTPEKFERLLNQLLEVITTSDILKPTISLLFENAVAQPTFCAMYADLCLSLSKVRKFCILELV